MELSYLIPAFFIFIISLYLLYRSITKRKVQCDYCKGNCMMKERDTQDGEHKKSD